MDEKLLCPNASCGHFGPGLSTRLHGRRYICTSCLRLLPSSSTPPPPCYVALVIGAARSGKTSWLLRALTAAADAGRGRFFLGQQWEQLSAMRNALELGRAVPPTQTEPGVAWCMDWEKESMRRRVYLFDTSHLATADARQIAQFRCLKHLNGIVLAIDPFGLPPVWSKYSALAASTWPPTDLASGVFGNHDLSTLLRALEVFRGTPHDERLDLSVAVVVTKLDLFGLNGSFGDEPNATVASVDAACRRQLEQSGCHNLMRALELHFERVSYFATYPRCSGPFSPATPLLWLLGAEKR